MGWKARKKKRVSVLDLLIGGQISVEDQCTRIREEEKKKE